MHAMVTGASSGIGRAVALRLARDGLRVFATVRNDRDAEALADAGAGHVIPLLMDVTEPRQIEHAVSQVADRVGDQGLDVLVNNAGVGIFVPLELISIARFRHNLDVNVIGQLDVTQRFLPLIRRAGGRILMMGSVADRITLPFAGPQAAAKHAILAMTEALRQELAPWHIPVVLIEPASIRSEAVDKLRRDIERTLDEFGEQGAALYGTAFQRMMARALAQAEGGSPPDVVADVVSRAVRSRRPKARYLVGRHALPLAALARLPAARLDAVRRRLLDLPSVGKAK